MSTPVAQLPTLPPFLFLSPPSLSSYPSFPSLSDEGRSEIAFPQKGQARKATLCRGERETIERKEEETREYNKLRPRAEKQQDNGRIGGLYSMYNRGRREKVILIPFPDLIFYIATHYILNLLRCSLPPSSARFLWISAFRRQRSKLANERRSRDSVQRTGKRCNRCLNGIRRDNNACTFLRVNTRRMKAFDGFACATSTGKMLETTRKARVLTLFCRDDLEYFVSINILNLL